MAAQGGRKQSHQKGLGKRGQRVIFLSFNHYDERDLQMLQARDRTLRKMNLIINGREEWRSDILEAAGGMRWEHQSSKRNEHLSSEKNTGLNLPWTGPGSFRKGKGWPRAPATGFMSIAAFPIGCLQPMMKHGRDPTGNPPWEVGSCSDGSIPVQGLAKGLAESSSGTRQAHILSPNLPPSLGVRPALFAYSSSFFQLPSFSLSTVS